MDIELFLAVAAFVASVLVPFMVEAFERPRLEIISSQWTPTGPTLWAFATIRIRNKPLAGPLAKLLTRQAAQGCVVDIDYFRWGTDERVMPTVHGHRYRDIPASSTGEEVAVAALGGGAAFAYSSETYGYNAFGHPAWRLDRGTYRIAVQVRGSSVDYRQFFKLEYLSDDFTRFRLEIILMLRSCHQASARL